MMYKSIDDMPQSIWRQMGKESVNEALKLVFLEPKKITRRNRKEAEARIQAIKDQYFEEIALDDDLELHLLKKVDREILRTELLIKPDNYKMTMFMKLDMEIKAAEKNVDTSDKKYYANKAILTKYMGGNYIDESKVSIREFHSWFKMMQAEYERAKVKEKTGK